MALSARLNLRQAQSLTMTPQLLQSIKLLQFTQAELEQFVDSQVEINPLIERVGADDDQFVDRDANTHNQDQVAENTEWDSTDLEVSAVAIADKLDTSLENVFPDDPGNSDQRQLGEMAGASSPLAAQSNSQAAGLSNEPFALEEMAGSQRSLREVIGEQIPFLFTTIAQYAIAEELVDRLDERGYLEADLPAIADRLGCDTNEVMQVLEALQTCDPAGVFARDLSECLSLQCARKNRLDPAMRALLSNLDLLAKRDFVSLKRICGVDENDLIDMFEEIKRLDPKPGLAFETSPSQAIVHDVEVSQAPDGSWRVELNNDALPKVIIDRQYYKEVSRSELKKHEKSFVADCMASASWLEKSLDQRAITILKVSTEIVRQQDGFLVDGISALKPMTMKAVADAIEMHESTISRVVSNKYMLTPRGLFELRYFFTVALSSSGDSSDEHSSEAVRHRIRTLIDAEAVNKVLSDDKLVDLLQGEGIDIARRTVAKYREAMNIPSSVQRRREKKAKLNATQAAR